MVYTTHYKQVPSCMPTLINRRFLSAAVPMHMWAQLEGARNDQPPGLSRKD